MGPNLDLTLVLRLLLASVLGAVIGLEREIHGRPAGFRTHLLVSLGSCLFVIASIEIHRIFGNFSSGYPIAADPGRVAAQVVSGIGFLGAGAIIRENASIRGLTTAACLWVAAALGLACGIGLFYLAICVTLVALASLLLLKQVESRLPKDCYLLLKVWGNQGEPFQAEIERILAALGIVPVGRRYDLDLERGVMFVVFEVKAQGPERGADLLERVGSVGGVRRVRLD